jgi:NAD(P)-dependent dehydrogenase (short-subunit alcohol dehydrogenase family)
VVLSARTVDQAIPGMPGTLAETAEAVRSLGREAHIVQADLTDTSSVEQLAQNALAWRDRIDVLVSNAAFMGRAAYFSLDELDLKNFLRQFTVNVTASFVLSKALVPSMRAAGGGTIVNITSGAGIIGEYSTPGITYGSTKAALNRLTTLLARDLAPDGITVFAVDPGYTRTVLVVQTAEQVGLDASNAHPPEVPAGVVADLIEGDPALTTGRIFKADSHAPMPEGVELDLSAGSA